MSESTDKPAFGTSLSWFQEALNASQTPEETVNFFEDPALQNPWWPERLLASLEAVTQAEERLRATTHALYEANTAYEQAKVEADNARTRFAQAWRRVTELTENHNPPLANPHG